MLLTAMPERPYAVRATAFPRVPGARKRAGEEGVGEWQRCGGQRRQLSGVVVELRALGGVDAHGAGLEELVRCRRDQSVAQIELLRVADCHEGERTRWAGHLHGSQKGPRRAVLAQDLRGVGRDPGLRIVNCRDAAAVLRAGRRRVASDQVCRSARGDADDVDALNHVGLRHAMHDGHVRCALGDDRCALRAIAAFELVPGDAGEFAVGLSEAVGEWERSGRTRDGSGLRRPDDGAGARDAAGLAASLQRGIGGGQDFRAVD